MLLTNLFLYAIVAQRIEQWFSKPSVEGSSPSGCTKRNDHMKAWAKKFYESSAWKVTRDSVMAECNYICNRCNNKHGPAEIVHHKIWLTPENIDDINITLNKENLEPLCRVCHTLEHEGVSTTAKGIMFDENGDLISYEAKDINE